MKTDNSDIEVAVFSIDGKETRKIMLNGNVFNLSTVNSDTIYYAIRNELANMRVGTASTKGRSEVRGSGAKPWKQKGTGRARAGHKRSPLWVGGGTVFGPKPRDYSYSMPKKVKRLAFRSILTQKTQESLLSVVEDFSFEEGKTKEMVQLLKAFSVSERSILILANDDLLIKRAGRNIPNLKVFSFNRLRAHDLFYAKRILLSEKAAFSLCDFYGV